MSVRGVRSLRSHLLTGLEKNFVVFCLCSAATIVFIFSYSSVDITCGECVTVAKQNEVLLGQIKALHARINTLENELVQQKKLLSNTRLSDILSSEEVQEAGLSNGDPQVYERKVKDAQDDVRFLLDEYDVIQYASFTQKYIYVVNSGTYGRVLERLEGVKKKDIQEVIMFATSKVYTSRRNSSERFLFCDGLFRTDPGIGTRYEIFFQSSTEPQSGTYHKVSIFRPFGPLHLIGTSTSNAHLDTIYMIMPLAGRTDMLKRFLANFVQTVVKAKENVVLTIAYSGVKGINETKALLDNIKVDTGFSGINLIEVRGKFSRGRALQSAVDQIQNDALMFFCDVDVIYRAAFLQRCRLNTIRGQKVYYPIIFSLYNPEVVYTLQSVRMPRERDLYVISSEAGFWRDFGYGMTCQYRSDFLRMGGFQKDIVGWGKEDVMLFRKYAQSNISIVRSVDHGLFHTWHQKNCDQSLSWDQFKSCIGSKARNEASHGLLGMMAFSDEVASYKRRHGMLHHTMKHQS